MFILNLEDLNEEMVKSAGSESEVRIKINDLKNIDSSVFYDTDSKEDLMHWVFRKASNFRLFYGDEEKNIPYKKRDGCRGFCKEVYSEYVRNNTEIVNDQSLTFPNDNVIVNLKNLAQNICEKWGDYWIGFNPSNKGNGVLITSDDEEETMNIYEVIDELSTGKDRQIIFHGAPGTGKTYGIRRWMENNCVEFYDYIEKKQNTESQDADSEDKKHVWQFVQFHPSYDYTDFVEGLRPAILYEDKENGTSSSEKKQTPVFIKMDGVFKQFCREAKKNEDKRDFYFVIDEINRADLGKVFGELMFGLEEDYRDKKIQTQYMNLPTYIKTGKGFEILDEKDDVFRDGFYIPKNVFIIGTMNDIDRSVDSLDFAMRRRFKWKEVTAEKVMGPVLEDMIGTDAEWKISLITNLKNRMHNVNDLIINSNKKLGLGEDYCIGPAYLKEFVDYNPDDTFHPDDNEFIIVLKTIWETKLEQILVNYCRGRDKEESGKLKDLCKTAFMTNPD